MRMVVCKERDAKPLLEKLELERVKASGNVVSTQGNPIDDAHRLYHYHVVKWLQEHGFDVI